MSQVIDANGNKSFDLRTELRDHKTGKVIVSQPYRMHVSREHGTVYERGGVLYLPNGERVDKKPVTPTVLASPKVSEDEPKGEQIAPGVYAPVTPAAVTAPDVKVESKPEAKNGTQTGNRSRA